MTYAEAVFARALNGHRHPPADLGDPAQMTDEKLASDHAEMTAQVVNITRQLADDREMNSSRGDAWRRRAMGARRMHQAQLDRLIAESLRRGLAFAGPPVARGLNGLPLPEPGRFEVAIRRQEQEAAAQRRAAANAERLAETEHREAERIAARLTMVQARAAAHTALLTQQSQDKAARAAEKAERLRHLDALKDVRDSRQERCFVSAANDLLGSDATAEIWDRAQAMFPDAAIWK